MRLKSNFLVLFLTFYSFLSAQELNYTIRRTAEKENLLFEVTLEFPGNPSGMTEIELPPSWAGLHFYQDIAHLQCLSPASLEDTDTPSVKTVRHLPNDRIKISYRIQSRATSEQDWFYRPFIDKTYFFFIGHALFIMPKINPQVQMTLEWRDFPPDWTIANSFGIGERKQYFSVALPQFYHAVYAGGDFRLLKCGAQQAPIYMAIRGNLFPDEQFAQTVLPIIEYQRSFWNDFDFPHFLITVLPISGPEKNRWSINGTGLTHAFALFLGGSPDDDYWNELTLLLSHEHFHTWNGTKMIAEPPENSLAWFIEGFTEFYSSHLNLRAGLISFLDRLDHLNSILYEYHSSPARNAKNSRIAEEFWTNNDVRRLSYLRGCLLALSWDKKIKTATRNRYSLDDFMRALFYTVQADQRLLTLDDIQQSASQFFPQKTVKEDLDNYILNGKTLSTDPHYFKNCKLEWMDNIGFDLVRTQTKDCIQGVREGSAAYQAGLRDGCRLIDYQCSNGIVTLRFQGHEGQKEVKYPYDSTDRIPQYKLLTLQ